MKSFCENCGSVFNKRDYRHRFCCASCRYEYIREIKRQQRLIRDENAKTREFTDSTYTLVAVAMIKNENLNVIIKMCKWNEDRFYQQLEKHKIQVLKRKTYIESRVW